MHSLLAKISHAASLSPSRAPDPIRDARDAVLAHLRQMVATRRGTVWSARNFGIEDPTQIFHDYPGSVDALCRGLESAIREYEPRLQNPSVTHAPSVDLILRLDIEGTLLVDGRRVAVKFTSRIDGACHTEVT
jgi:type VI secretion system protein